MTKLIIILFTLLSVYKLAGYALVGGDFGFFHLMDEPYLGILGGPIDDTPSYKNITSVYLPHAVLGRVLHFTVDFLFSDRIRSYRLMEIVIILVVNLSFYGMLKKVTKSTAVSLTAALFLSVIYQGFEIYSQYAYFIERVPVIPLIFLSFIYWVKALDTNNTKYYILSSGIYIITVLLGHYAVLFFPLFFFYALVSSLTKKEGLVTLKNLVVKLIPLVLVLALVVRLSGTGPSTFESQGRRKADTNPVNFLLRQSDLFSKVAIQLTSIIVPGGLITYIDELNPRLSFGEVFFRFAPFAIVFYIALSWIVFKFCKDRYRNIFLTAQCSFLGSTVVNLYLDRADFYSELGASRLYFIPYIFFSMAVGIIVVTLLRKPNNLLNFAVISVTAASLLLNLTSIHEALDYHQTAHAGVLKVIDWARDSIPYLAPEAVVVLPQQLGPTPVYFFQKYYGKRVSFLSYDQFLDLGKVNENLNLIELNFNEFYIREIPKKVEIIATPVE